MKSSLSYFSKVPFHLILSIILLQILSLLNVYSGTQGLGDPIYIQKLFKQHLIWMGLSWICFFLFNFLNYFYLKKISTFFYLFCIFLLVYVLFFGKQFSGSVRWIDLGIIHFQPSEIAKLSLILVFSSFLIKKKDIYFPLSYKEFFYLLILTLIPFILILKQPDLGTALMLFFIASSFCLFMKLKKSILILSTVSLIVLIPLSWNFVLKDYQKERLKTFLSIKKDPKGAGYNAIQSKIAIGSGMLYGKGFLKGSQSQLNFIPERHSDFIFSIFSEEFGFLGSLILILLICNLLWSCLRIAMQAEDRYGSLLAFGVASFIFWQSFINLAMTLNLLPVVGVPLPIISYGGSSLIVVMSSLGILSSIHFYKHLF